MLLFIGGPEIFVIVLIVVMFFGADKIPEIARTLGKGMRQIKDATNGYVLPNHTCTGSLER